MSAVASDYYATAKLYETCRMEAEQADVELQRIQTLNSELAESFPALKKELYPDTKNWDLSQSFFKDTEFRRIMKDRFEEWSQKEVDEEDPVIRKRRFSSMCRELESTCLNPVFVQFKAAKENFLGKTFEKIARGATLDEIQKELGDLGQACCKAADWYLEFKKPREEDSKSPFEPAIETDSYY